MGNLNLLMFLMHYTSTVGEEEDKHTIVSMPTIFILIELYIVCVFVSFLGEWVGNIFLLKMSRIIIYNASNARSGHISTLP